MDGKFDCEGVGNLLDIYGLAVSMGIELKKNNRKKTKRVLCDEINDKQEGFQWLHSVAKDAKPYFDEDRGQTMIMIAFDFFAYPSAQPAVQYLYIHHTEGEPFLKDDVEMIKVYWSGFENATNEPTQNILDAGYESKTVTAKYTEEQEKQFLITETSALEQKRKEIENQKQATRVEKEKVEREQVERERAERVEKERAERAERERLEKERVQRERAERERLEKEQAEKEAREKVERKRAETERVEKERVEKERVERERAEKERVEKVERERVARERIEREEREKVERERVAKERVEKESKERWERAQKEQKDKEQRRREQEERIEQERKKARTMSSTSSGITTYTTLQRPPTVTEERKFINNSIAPCVAGKVDRSCLVGARNRYVETTINSNIYGTLGKEIGQGTYGKVYKTDKNFAIKCLQQTSQHPDQLSDNDMREMCLLRNLNHPNVVEIYQVAIGNAVADCKIAVAMKLLSGGLHRVELFNKPNLRAFVMYQIVRSVAYIHSHGILHRDIKPHNFLFDMRNNQVVLADFGTAQGLAIPNNRYSKRITTSWFRAPEIFLNFERYDGAVDVWSIGASWLFFLQVTNLMLADESLILEAIYRLVGYPSQTNFPAALKQSKYQAPVTQHNIDLAAVLKSKGASDSEINLIQQMLRLNPNDRITAFKALGHSYFDDIRSKVIREFPAAPIVPPSLTRCGALLIAMQKEPVGNYFKTDDDKATLKKVFKWISRVIKVNTYRSSLFFFTTSICHRYLKQKQPESSKYFLIAAASMDIAWKLDADYSNENPYTVDLAVLALKQELIVTSAQSLITIENDIIKTLDMDFDRPTPYTIIELLATYRVIGEEIFKLVVQTLNSNEEELTTLGKTSLEAALFALRQHSISTECQVLIEKIFPEFAQQ